MSFAIRAHRSARFSPFAMRALSRVTALFELARQRRDLANLDHTRLDDLGICPKEVQTEINRSFWDVPPHWTH